MAQTYEDRFGLAAFNALAAAVEGAAAGEAGTCKLVVGSYRGTGAWGSNTANHHTVLTFDGKPFYVSVHAGGTVHGLEHMELSVGASKGRATVGSNVYEVPIAYWTDNSVAWYTPTTGPEVQMNRQDVTYHYIAMIVR